MPRVDRNAAAWIVGIVLAVMTALALWTLFTADRSVKVHIGDALISARVADTGRAREQGLSGVRQLPENQGMLFVFDEEGTHGIWMKDMHLDLDIIWIDERKRVVHITKNVSPDTYPHVFKPDRPSLYVLEVPAGTVDSKKINIGTQARFDL